MNIEQLLGSRRSVRAFLDLPVDRALIEHLLQTASRAPSGGNLQPWHFTVVIGGRLASLKTLMAERTQAEPRGEAMEYAIYPDGLPAPYETRRRNIGEAMYERLGILRSDRDARRNWFAQNFQLFGAPVGLFCHFNQIMGPPQWSDLGMFLQSFMLLAVDAGLATCPQECWAMYPGTVKSFLGLPSDHTLFCGMALGYADPDAEVNRLVSPRAGLEEFVTFDGD